MTNYLRSFIAIELPRPVTLAADIAQRKLRAAGIYLKWVRPENMHLTLRFLGDIEQMQIPEIKSAISAAVKGVLPFTLNACRIGVFPNLRSPRVVWMGIEGQMDSLNQIYQRLGEELIPLGFAFEQRAFAGHVTLGRVNSRISPQLLQEAISAVGRIESENFTVDRICFIKSELKPTGAVYTRLAEIFISQEEAVKLIYRDFHQEES